MRKQPITLYDLISLLRNAEKEDRRRQRDAWDRDDIWFTDGYGDYVRHYLRAMAAFPELTPSGKNRFLGTTSLVTSITYNTTVISYSTYGSGIDILRLKSKPKTISCDGTVMKERNDETSEG